MRLINKREGRILLSFSILERLSYFYYIITLAIISNWFTKIHSLKIEAILISNNRSRDCYSETAIPVCYFTSRFYSPFDTFYTAFDIPNM